MKGIKMFHFLNLIVAKRNNLKEMNKQKNYI